MTIETARIIAAMDATWPAAEVIDDIPGWRLRRGERGGKRVSSATRRGAGDIGAAEERMRALGQAPLFQIWPGDEDLDAALAARGYEIVDPVVVYAASASALADIPPRKGVRTVRVRTRLVMLDETWDAGGIGPARRAVMARAKGPKTVLMARTDMVLAGAVFVAVDRDIAMVHALEVPKARRRAGAGTALMREAARFAREEGAETLALAVTRANSPARALYAGLGMAEATGYHYRILP